MNRRVDRPGVYGIVNTVNGNVYVGSTCRSMFIHWLDHKRRLRKGAHHNSHLNAAWDKYGKEAFRLIPLEIITDRIKLHEREQAWIDIVKKQQHIYNMVSVNTAAVMSENMAKSYPAFRNFYTGELIPASRNMSKMCRNRGLNRKAFSLMKLGVGFSSQGWILEENWQKYLAGELSQKETECANLLRARFYPAFRNIYIGIRIPSGINLTKLCRKEELNLVGLEKVKNKEMFSCKGWVLEENWKEALSQTEPKYATTKLTWKKVKTIRSSSLTHAALARYHNVNQATISRIRNYKTWKKKLLWVDNPINAVIKEGI